MGFIDSNYQAVYKKLKIIEISMVSKFIDTKLGWSKAYLRGGKGGFTPPKPFLVPLKDFNDAVQQADNEVSKAQNIV